MIGEFIMGKIRLDKMIANMGLGTRKEIKQLIKKNQVTINGEAIKDSSIQIDPEIDEVFVLGERLEYKEYFYIMLNKPQGVVSATEDRKDTTVIELLEEKFQRLELFPVGRLDKDTEGLLLLTNDGQLAHRLLSPKKHVTKTYYAKIDGQVTEEDTNAFSEGIILDDGYRTLPAKLEILKTQSTSEVLVTIYEGKFHQVKRMFEAVGKKVIYLKRLSMGELILDEELALGDYRELTQEELNLLPLD